ncbi:MAG TPA: DNA topoisomerase IB [Burkholderiales bacterium]|nr:DNA topoisomerase IB [Burkholderiales bacterium]
MRSPAAETSRGAPPPVIPKSTAETLRACDDLRYSSDSEPGIRRKRAGKGYTYVDARGKRVSDEATLARIRRLAIPPAYRDVWICRDERGHVQATGIDARGRKQYRYHPKWRQVRDAHKFERMNTFGRALPKIHRRVARDLKLAGMPREKVLATIVRLLEHTLIRVGNDEYARTNDSYGLTTLRNRHVKVNGRRVQFRFRGKHGIVHEIELEDPRAAKVLRGCLELPGQELFGYVDDDGSVRDVGSTDVNEYLKEITGDAFTAKDFRTWHATAEALAALAGHAFAHQKEAQAKMKEVLQSIADTLGNTPAMCRKCYVNPVVIDAYLAGELRGAVLRGTVNERVRLLQLLAHTPHGKSLEGPLRKSLRKARTKRSARNKH